MTLVALLLLISRGAILAFLFFIFLIIKDKISFSTKSIQIAFIVSFSSILVYSIGLLDPLIARMDNTKGGTTDDISSGRLTLIESLVTTFRLENAYIFGLGPGNVYRSSDISKIGLESMYSGAPHNSFVLVLLELRSIWFPMFYNFLAVSII